MAEEPRVEFLWVIHEFEFHYQCICQKILDLRPLEEGKKFSEYLLPTVDDFITVGTTMKCPVCNTGYRIVNIDCDTSDKHSGAFKAELSLASGATNETGARLRMLMLEDE